MLIQETWKNATENYISGDSGLYEPFTDDSGKLYRSLQREYGKCVSKVYIDDENGKSKPIGWVFQKRQKYDDCNKTYLLETWVTLHEEEPTKTTEYHYHYL